MANVPEDLSYTKSHEWIRISGDNATATIGLTDHAQRQLGDVVFVTLPKVGDRFAAEEPVGTVESVKAVSELFMPVSGTVTAVNEELIADPELINTDTYGDGWLITVRVEKPAELKELLNAKAYADYIREEESA